MFKQSDVDALCHQVAAESTHYVFNQVMLRVKDPIKSLEFYIKHLGFHLVEQRDFPDMKFSLFFLTTLAEGEVVPTDAQQRKAWLHSCRTVLELTYNYDTELDADFKYHNGNDEPRGFGHLGVSVPDLQEACAKFEVAGVDFVKKPSDGKMRSIAFLRDPDGYWVEILQQC